jgi:cytochrome c-type biogenesis protein CcmH
VNRTPPQLRQFTTLVGVLIAIGASAVSAQSRVESDARALEERLHAPCCRGQMLDAHESEITRTLRREIRTRLESGQAAASIEGDLVSRYGASIVAVPLDRDPRAGLSFFLAIALALTAGTLTLFGMRWVRMTRASTAGAAAPIGDPQSDALDARIDEELRRLDP